MKKIKIFGMMLAIAAVALIGCVACDGGETLNNIEYNGRIYADGEQTIAVTGTTSAMGDAPAEFQSDVSVGDIKLGGALAKKTVQSVTFVSSDEIQIVLSGEVTFEGEAAEGKITVSSRALKGGNSSYCIVWVNKPSLSVGSNMSFGSSTNKTISSTLTLPYGSFTTDATTEHITLVDSTNGVIESVELHGERELTITVKDFNPSLGESYPAVRLDACTTTFNREVVVTLGRIASYPLK